MDIIDRAQELERVMTQYAIAAARTPGVDIAPKFIDGRRHCVDCGKPIPENRLRIAPDAIRCVACQRENETNNFEF